MLVDFGVKMLLSRKECEQQSQVHAESAAYNTWGATDCSKAYPATTLEAWGEHVDHLVFTNEGADEKIQQCNGSDEGRHHTESQAQQDGHCVIWYLSQQAHGCHWHVLAYTHACNARCMLRASCLCCITKVH